MGKTTYKACVDVLQKNFKKGDIVGLMELRDIIEIEIGSDPRTVDKTLRLMSHQKMIKDVNYCHFEILV